MKKRFILRLASSRVDTWPMEEIIAVLQGGGIIAYPTETVYGLGVDALNEDAVLRLFRVKSRAYRKPVSVLVRDAGMLGRIVSAVPSMAKPIMQKYWPGPVTLIFPASPEVPPDLTSESGTIGARISPHPFVKHLFHRFNSPLTSTSANLSGEKVLMVPEEIDRTFQGRVDLVIAMPGLMEGRESTVVDVTGKRPRIVRHGAVEIEGIPG